MGANTIWADLSPRPSCDLLWTRSHETRGSMTLIMRAEEEGGESNRAAEDLLPPQVRHLFCFRERSLSPPQRRGRGGDGGWDEVTGGQEPFSVSPLWQWFVSARLNYVCVCVCASGRNTCYLMEPLFHTHTHTHIPSLALCFDLAPTWASIWFTCPRGISSSRCQVITLCPNIYSAPLAPPPPPGGWEISNHQLMLTPVCTQC